ncbi:efflux RND transporter periplasmic adaptor subunit [uncultured Dokdonia sp.]|uniref:efflux RND transporter periplasmic adaptor subunit n=1 Tax=Dokdonia sp. R78006 TaxID=3093866 RepID=UPI00260F535D|nr:efflux RND transporter periplasmic adaptor subunit [uncultured Dokdonia sp.]
MKKYITLAILSIALVSCGGDSNGKSVETLIESGTVEELQSKKEALKAEITTSNEQLAQIEKVLEEKTPRDKKEVLITTMTVKDTLFNHFIEVQGNVETKQNVLIYPEYQGTLSRVLVKEGQRVRKGQLLARIDDGGLGSQVAQVESQAALAKTTFERQQRLWDQKIGSEIQYLQAKTQYESSQNMVNQIKSQLGKTTVTAPFSGVIDEVITDQGTVVAPGVAIFRIVNLDNMYVAAEIPESYLPTVTAGKTVKVEFPVLGESIDATVRQTGNYIKPSNRSFAIEVDVPNKDGKVKPNLTARLSINDYTAENAILIPLNVINENADGEQYVYIAFAKADEMIAQQKIITTGKSQGDRIEVLSGIEVGDKIIVEGARSVKDNQAVKILTY